MLQDGIGLHAAMSTSSYKYARADGDITYLPHIRRRTLASAIPIVNSGKTGISGDRGKLSRL